MASGPMTWEMVLAVWRWTPRENILVAGSMGKCRAMVSDGT